MTSKGHRKHRDKHRYFSYDGLVEKVNLAYKNFKIGEKVYEYTGVPDTIINRSVRNLSLIVPVSEDGHSTY